MEFTKRSDLLKSITSDTNDTSDNYQLNLLNQLRTSVASISTWTMTDEPDIQIKEIEKQKEFFWIRIYLSEDDTRLKMGDIVHIEYKPTNEKLEMIFGGYEKVGLTKNYDEEVINYVNDDDKKILCCMIDLHRVNVESEDIPTIRTLFRNSRHYIEELYFKRDIVISFNGHEYDYTSIGF